MTVGQQKGAKVYRYALGSLSTDDLGVQQRCFLGTS